MSSHSWLRTDMSANRWQQTYFKNFVDISGDLYIRKGGISAGDNADKFTVDSNGDISANSINLNNNFIVASGGAVGIGITSPSSELDVSGGANISGNLSVVSGVQIQDGGSAIYVKSNNKNRLVLGDKVLNGANNNTIVVHNNKVGIGGVWTPSHTLDVSGDIDISGGILTGDNGEYFPIRHTDFTSYNQGQLLFRRSGHVYLGGEQLRFCIGDPTDNTKVKMMIAGSGNIGIGTGTNAPGAKLDVDGDIHATSLDINSSAFTVSSSGVVNAASLSATSLSATTLSGTLNTAAQPNITSVGELNSLDVSGPVHLYSGDGSEGGEITLAYPDITSSSGTQKKWHIDVDSSSRFRIFNKEGSSPATNAMNISTNGNVGIGTTDPKTKLEIPVTGPYDGLSLSYSSVKLVLGNTVDGAHNSGSIQVFSGVSGATPGSSSDKYKLSLQPLGGNVGIGTNNPSGLLHLHKATGNDGGLWAAANIKFTTNYGVTYYDSAVIEAYVKANNGTTGGFPGGLAFKTKSPSPSPANDPTIPATTKMVIDANGNVGIGTTTPIFKLQIIGDDTNPEPVLAVVPKSGGNSRQSTIALYGTFGGSISDTSPRRVADITAGFTAAAWMSEYMAFHVGASIDNTGPGASNAENFERMRITGTGNVGIGTNNPQYTLDVSGDIDISGGMLVGKSDPTYFKIQHKDHNADGTIPEQIRLRADGDVYITSTSNSGKGIRFSNGSSEVVRITGGNVGIGTTSPASGYKLDVNGVIGANTFTGNSTGTTLFTSSSGHAVLRSNGGNAYIDATGSNNIVFRTTNASTNRMYIANDGDVGIGTINPAYKLDVAGDIQFSGNLYKNGLSFNPGSQWTTTGSNIYYNTGYVGIGTTDPGYELDVGGDINSFGDGTANVRLGSFQSVAYLWCDDGTTALRFGLPGGEKMRITNDGNVGIGTTSPKAKLHIEHKGGTIGDFTGLRIAHEAIYQHQTVRPAYEFIVSDMAANTGIGASKFSIRYRATNVESDPYYDRLIIDNAGNVGIGTTNPSKTLDVSGDIQFSGYLYKNGALFNPGSQWTTTGSNIYYNTGYVGIGTTSPVCPLDVDAVATSFNLGQNHYKWYNFQHNGPHETEDYFGYNLLDLSIRAQNNIMTYASLVVASDERIKTNITDIQDDSALETLRTIQPKTYNYIDVVTRTNKTVYGFIAQQIREVLPHATGITKSSIPNIFESANVSQSDNRDYNIITLTDFDTADLDASSNIIQVIGTNNAKHTVTISEVIDNKTIRVDTDLSEWMGYVDASNETVIPNEVQTYSQVILDASNNVVLENYDIEPIASIDASDNVVGKIADLTGDNTIDSSGNYVDASGNTIASINADGHYIDASGNYFDADGNFKDASGSLIGTYKAEWKNVTIHGTSIFVYGQEVDDFHTMDKNAIFTVATAALQEVDRQLQAEKAKVAALESQMADLLARVTALESA